MGLKLSAIGFAELQTLDQPDQITANNITVTYQWNDYLREWWVNSATDLEQWFELEQRPPGAPDYFVPVNIWVLAVPNQTTAFALFSMAYSENTDPLNAMELIGNSCVTDFTLDAQVKRLAADRWSIESNPINQTACLWDYDSGYENQTGTPVVMPFYF